MVWRGDASGRVAKCLLTLLDQVDARWPNRRKGSDGTIGDAAHAARASDHNKGDDRVVEALDLTHDPANGFDSYKFAEVLRTARDPRIDYVISNGRIFYGHGAAPWQWQRYTQSNQHTEHVHVSCSPLPSVYDRTEPWVIEGAAPKPGLHEDIVATVFGGPSDSMSGTQTAYGSLVAPNWWDRPGVALPARFTERPLPQVRVTHNGKSVVCPVMDVGPWNIKDPYWVTGSRPQAESGVDMSGRRTNLAGIDLTPAAANEIGLQGKGVVDWEFVKENTVAEPETTAPNNTQGPTLNINNELLAQALGQLILPLLISVLTQGKGIQLPNLALPPPPPPPPPAPTTGTSMPDFITGLLGLLGVAGAQGAGVVDVTSGTGLIAAAVPAVLSLAGMGGVSIIPRLISGVLGLFGAQITRTK